MERFNVDTDNNKIELLDARFYEYEGNYFPSVTTILDAYPKSPAFYEWLKVAGEKADEIRDQFGKRGSVVHNLTEQYDKGNQVSLLNDFLQPQFTSLEWAMFERYVEFAEKFSPEILLIEANYCSPDLMFGGTLDRIINFQDKKMLIDIKTSNYLHNHYWLQLAAYVKLFEEKNPGSKIDEVAILWLNAKTRTDGRNGAIQGRGWQLKFPEKPITHYWDCFLATQKLWQEENATLSPKNEVYKLQHVKEPVLKLQN